MAQWGSSSESGILRKNKPKENFDELLVFGYACKLFRDDDKALYIDQGKHLIPWMGDEALKIDRYDCRGALSDLRMYEASREGFDAMRWLGLNDSDRKLEELCDKERYYSLHINEEEEEMYKEEEQKRKNTNAIHYSYDVPTKPETSTEEVPTVPEQDDEEEVYVPPPNLDVPADIEIPKTVKESTRIEKTALFVSKQGPQMEILIKAKQSDNPQFSFLNQSDPLYKFYRHVLNAYKSGRYLPPPPKTEEKPETTTESDSSSHYLHPSLLSSSISHSDNQCGSSKLSIPAVPFKPSANCAYSQLVNRIQGNQNEAVANADPPKGAVEAPPAANYAQMTYEQQQYYQYYYASQYYEYYKQMAQYQQQNAGQSAENQVTQPPDFNLDPNLQTYLQQMAYNQYMQHHQQTSNNSYAQIVSNVNKDSTNPYTAMVPNLPAAVTDSNGSKQNATNDSNNFDRKVTIDKVKETKKSDNQSQVNAKKSLLSLMEHYGSDTDDSESEKEENVSNNRKVYVAPKGEIQTIIDKMANYVAKNGEQFEERVKAKKDPRFLFLNDDHEFNMYYREKIKEYKAETTEKAVKEERIVIQNVQAPAKIKEKKVIAPVSFSIKKPKEDPPKEIKSALPLEESDDEEGEKSSTEISTTATTPTVTTETANCNLSDTGSKTSEESDNNKKNGILLDSDDPILEMIDLTEDLAERRDLKRAEDRIKDKLAAAVREKMASASRDSKTLQLERKRKVEAFLKMKNSANVNDPPIKDTSRSNSVERVKEDQSSTPKQKEEIVRISSRSRSRSLDGNKIRLSSCEKDSGSDHSKMSERKRRHRDKSRSCEKRRHRRDNKDKHKSSHDRHRKHDKHKLDKYEVVHISDSDSDERHSAKKYKKKKAHKRKHESKSKKKSKKRRRRSNSSDSRSSAENS